MVVRSFSGLTHEEKRNKGETLISGSQANDFSERPLFLCVSPVSNIPWQQSILYLGQAYQKFFQSCTGKRKGKKIKPPKLKRRKSTQSARFRTGAFKINQHNVYLAKTGLIKIESSRTLPSEPSSFTVIKDAANRYFLSCVVQVNPEKLPENGQGIGIDLGILDLATFNKVEKVKDPKPLKKKLKRLRNLQRNLPLKTERK